MENPNAHRTDHDAPILRRRPGYPEPRWAGFRVAWFCVVLLSLFVSPAAAQFSSPMVTGSSRQDILKTDGQPWSLEAKEIHYDHRNEVYEAKGDVRISSGNRSLEAQYARLEVRDQQVELTGSVLIRYGRDWLKGDHVVWHLDTDTGWVDGGTAYFSDSGFYLSAREIWKTGAQTFQIQEGQVSSCDPEQPDWSIRYRDAKIDLDGVGTAKHSRFYVGKLPVFYLPWIAFPVDRDRQSGFLPPKIALSGLNGFEYEQPFFWAIRQDMDLTLFARYLEKRGFMSGAEYRINHNTFGEGIWLFHYLKDRAGEQYLADNGYPFQQTDRYWFRARHEFQLPYDINGALDLDIVSDQNFLKEFDVGSVSYSYTNDLFRQFSNRDILNDKTVTTRENSLYLWRTTENTLTAVDTRYWDDLNKLQDETTLQQLPMVFFDVVPTWFNRIPFYYSLESSAVNYYRRQGDAGFRVNLSPRFYYPVHIQQYLDLEPSVGFDLTGYRMDWEENDKNSTQGRFLSDFRLNLSSRINRVYAFDRWNIVALQHAFRPEIVYEYVPDANQDDLPDFDDLDWIAKRNSVRYGFSTFLTAKKITTVKDQQTTWYQEMARLQVSQTYEIEKTITNQTVDETTDEIPIDADQNFSDVDIELDITPRRYLTLSYDLSVSPYSGTISSQELSFMLNSHIGHWLQLNYRIIDDTEVDELITRFQVQLWSNLTFNAYQDYSFDKKELFRQSYGLTYTKGCWGVRMAYREEGDNQWFTLAFNLRGIGDVGGDFWH